MNSQHHKNGMFTPGETPRFVEAETLGWKKRHFIAALNDAIARFASQLLSGLFSQDPIEQFTTKNKDGLYEEFLQETKKLSGMGDLSHVEDYESEEGHVCPNEKAALEIMGLRYATLFVCLQVKQGASIEESK